MCTGVHVCTHSCVTLHKWTSMHTYACREWRGHPRSRLAWPEQHQCVRFDTAIHLSASSDTPSSCLRTLSLLAARVVMVAQTKRPERDGSKCDFLDLRFRLYLAFCCSERDRRTCGLSGVQGGSGRSCCLDACLATLWNRSSHSFGLKNGSFLLTIGHCANATVGLG